MILGGEKFQMNNLINLLKLLRIFRNYHLYIDETPAISIAAMSNRARRIKRLHGLDLIVVDYIQLMTGSINNRDGRVQEISQITQGLKAIAKELKSSRYCSFTII